MKNLVKALIATTAPAALLAPAASTFATRALNIESGAADRIAGVRVCADKLAPVPSPSPSATPPVEPIRGMRG
jgi:hypothetical protein